MSSRGPRSAFSSRDASPSSPPARYDDPFASEADPIEMTHMPRPSVASHDSHGSRGHFPLRSPDPDDTNRGRASLRPDSYFGLGKPSGGQYAPLSGRNESPQPSVRSGHESVYSLGSRYHSKQMDADTQALVDRRAGEIAEWHIHWTTPAMILSLFVAGVAGAVGHHFFYAKLNGQEATDQLKMMRYGTALAFFVKSTLVGCSIMCNRQRIWRTFRQKAMTIEGIDGLFSAPEDPTQFFINGEMWKNGKLATFMALCCWLIPIASVMSPASLTSELQAFNLTTTCSGVANLDFARESDFNFRIMDDNEPRRNALSYYNTTDLAGKKEGYFDYYDQPSKNVRRLAISAAYLKRPQPREQAALTFCGRGWNCTYEINFVGPGYKCEDITESVPANAPFKLSQLAPEGNFTYVANVDQGDYKSPQIDTLDGVPRQPPPYPASLGVFESEPMLWIGYALKSNATYPPDSPYAMKWKVIHTPKMFQCTMHHTNYTFEISYRPTQHALLKHRTFLHPALNTTLTPSNSNSTASPSTSFLHPSTSPRAYKLHAAYHSLGSLLRAFLRGSVHVPSPSFTITQSDISETRLIDARTSHPIPALAPGVQALFEDMLLSLLSEPTLVVASPLDAPCIKTRSINTYRYFRRGLWIGYTGVILLTASFVLVGAHSIVRNGVSSDVLFSRIMATTRNGTLDHLCVGACLGGDPFPRELVRAKLRFGVLRMGEGEGGVGHACFGTVGETGEIRKGGRYA